MHLSMKGNSYADVEANEKACTDIFKDVSTDDLKRSFDILFDRANGYRVLRSLFCLKETAKKVCFHFENVLFTLERTWFVG